MARFFLTAIEQMDLALDQLLIPDPNYKRFAMMLIDNVVELCLHSNAASVAFHAGFLYPGKIERYPKKLLHDAVGRGFENKVELAKKSGFVSEEVGNTILTLHSFRNEAYHTGNANDLIISELARFYFRIACDLFISGPPVVCLQIDLDARLPLRVKKHIGSESIERIQSLSPTVFERLKAAAESLEGDLLEALLNDVANVILEIDNCIRFLVEHDYHSTNREEVVAQAIAVEERRGQVPTPTVETDGNVTIYGETWPEPKQQKHPKDPPKTYIKQYRRMEGERNPHAMLARHRDFLAQSEFVRSAIRGQTVELQLELQSREESPDNYL